MILTYFWPGIEASCTTSVLISQKQFMKSFCRVISVNLSFTITNVSLEQVPFQLQRVAVGPVLLACY